MISDRHAHNKTDVSIHRSVGVRECSISREGQPMPPCHPPSEDVEDGKCRAASICTVTDNSQCDEQVFCRDVTEPSVATISISSNGNHHDHDDDEKVYNKTGFLLSTSRLLIQQTTQKSSSFLFLKEQLGE